MRLHYVEVERPELASPSGDLIRLFEALEREWGLTGLESDLHVVRALQPALAEGDYAVTVAVHEGRTLTAVWPGYNEELYGVAIDVGSTTLAGHLVRLANGEVLASSGVMNPQIRFGEDLMSRVSYAMLHPEGAGEMTRAVRAALKALVTGLARDAGVDRRTSSSWRSWATRSCTTSCSASTRPRSARRRSRSRPTGRSARGPSSWASPRTRARVRTCCRASPGTSARTRPA